MTISQEDQLTINKPILVHRNLLNVHAKTLFSPEGDRYQAGSPEGDRYHAGGFSHRNLILPTIRARRATERYKNMCRPPGCVLSVLDNPVAEATGSVSTGLRPSTGILAEATGSISTGLRPSTGILAEATGSVSTGLRPCFGLMGSATGMVSTGLRLCFGIMASPTEIKAAAMTKSARACLH